LLDLAFLRFCEFHLATSFKDERLVPYSNWAGNKKALVSSARATPREIVL
jgi:hypothetical protein